MPLIRRKIAKRPPHGEDPRPPTSEKCSKKALYTATKLNIIFQGGRGGRAPTLASTVDAHAWGGGGQTMFP